MFLHNTECAGAELCERTTVSEEAPELYDKKHQFPTQDQIFDRSYADQCSFQINVPIKQTGMFVEPENSRFLPLYPAEKGC